MRAYTGRAMASPGLELALAGVSRRGGACAATLWSLAKVDGAWAALLFAL